MIGTGGKHSGYWYHWVWLPGSQVIVADTYTCYMSGVWNVIKLAIVN